MSALLWLLVVVGFVTMFVFFANVAEETPPRASQGARCARAAYALCIGVWALWLLAKGSS